ncbi:MAG: glycosyltransferase family 4 protein [Acidimicrobiales bacterium]
MGAHRMAVKRIDQVIPSLASRDAIGGHTLQLRDLVRSRGYASEIYYGDATADRLEEGLPIDRLGDPSSNGRVLLYQLSIGSGVADVFRERSERKFVNYHNITPAGLIEDWIPEVGEEVRWGRAQMGDLAAVSEFAIADSRFNERELQQAGYRSTTTVPLLVDFASFEGTPDRAADRRLVAAREKGGTDLLFVGKVSPHKGQHDLIKALSVYRRLYDSEARLHLVGGAISDSYQDAIRRYADELGLSGAVELAGSVTHAELIAYYTNADVFVCLSEHEGFCVPLLEAMYHRLPVIAYDCTAISETVRGAGLVLPDKSPGRVAAAVDRVVTDGRLRSELSEAASDRIEAQSLDRVRQAYASAIELAAAR